MNSTATIAREVVVVANGGNGIWELIAELLPSTSSRRVVEILDWYHAASHGIHAWVFQQLPPKRRRVKEGPPHERVTQKNLRPVPAYFATR
ncbi:MAG: hypothetical protein A2289_06940 [Deltaproteobacteria bacterium RIFOXYA12_FULL_58_15]|nr:MAG: hypothetical protein A2289_06940 [Deltaproteobacteria bacterium RIFOXYA12_FULL_58_15]OGR14399.1 MAG: hypothetical protein A2341_04590 [Deltaproteobacteria bacterium RIFOXYB12_FULL_58_9]